MAAEFDPLTYCRRLREAGFSEKQAEARAEALASVVSEKLATKHDLRELEYRLTIRLGAMMAFSIGAVAALVKLA